MPPLYELEEGTSRKFYRIELVGTRIELHWGRIGTDGQKQTIEAVDEDAAKREYYRQIEKRSERGYRKVVNEEFAHDPEAKRKERLGKALTDSPRYLFVHKKKRRFVWLEAQDGVLLIAQGALGTEATATPAREACASAARKRDTEMARLLGEGYELATFGTAEKKARAPRTKVVVNEEQEGLVRAAIDDEGRWVVLEDWVLEQDDVRSAWLRASKADEPEARGRALPALLGPRWETLMRLLEDVEWRAGFIRSATLTVPKAAKVGLLAELGKAPGMALVRSLVIRLDRSKLGMLSELEGSKLVAADVKLYVGPPGLDKAAGERLAKELRAGFLKPSFVYV